MAPHDWRLVASYEVSDKDVAEMRDGLRSQIAGFITDEELSPTAGDDLMDVFRRFMLPENIRATSIHCDACKTEWVPGEAVVPGGPQAGDECPARST